VFFSTLNKTNEKKLTNEKKDILKTWEKNYPYRKYLHVKNFYKNLAPKAIKVCLKYNVPPAAVLAMAGVESGYGRGYIAKITGNILSLGAKRNEAMLPALYLPNIINFPSKVLYSTKTIDNYAKDELDWKKRSPSFKKDYRPKEIAGSAKVLDFFDKNPKKRLNANIANIEDFCKNWINKDKRQKAFSFAKIMLDNAVKLHSKDILFTKALNDKFINAIGGKKNSFNYRKTWPKKIKLIMNRVGLVALSESLHVSQKKFDDLW
jgi:hypothetical protein